MKFNKVNVQTAVKDVKPKSLGNWLGVPWERLDECVDYFVDHDSL